jgi:hypothetical protein
LGVRTRRHRQIDPHASFRRDGAQCGFLNRRHRDRGIETITDWLWDRDIGSGLRG